ncbi:hypothetical protein MKX03_025853 [Papaver bracteatum]|nr:hypothetical protein MKX03_025853 [Papaver bracteatum]
MRRANFSYGVEIQKKKSMICKSWIKLLHARKSIFTDMHISHQLNRLYSRDAAHGDDDKLDMGFLFGCTTGANGHVSLFYGGSRNTDDTYDHKKILKKVRHPPMHFDLPQEYMVGSCNGRNLCFFHQTVNAPHMEIWSLKKGDAKESWCKDFSIVHEMKRKLTLNLFWPLVITKTNKILFTHDYETIQCYDPITTTWKEIVPEDPHFLIGNVSVISQVNTFISLKALGGKSKASRIKIIGKV